MKFHFYQLGGLLLSSSLAVHVSVQADQTGGLCAEKFLESTRWGNAFALGCFQLRGQLQIEIDKNDTEPN